MDNGLIFPYPCVRAHTEAVLLTVQTITDRVFFKDPAGFCCAGPALVVGKRGGDAGR